VTTNITLSKDIKSTFSSISQIKTDSLCFVWDENIDNLYGNSFVEQIKKIDQESNIWICPKGEMAKSFESYQRGMNFLLEKGIHRGTHLVAIGGGATSDLAGFMSATLLRGISWSIVPTTLLSMVDASIGGKVAINSAKGKNLIGAFHLPENIFIDPELLNTLSKKEYQNGYGEIIKYAFLDEEIFNCLVNMDSVEDLINKSARLKQRIISEDFMEKGERKKLNLGHTFGHCLEKIYSLDHGEAVFWGMVLVSIVFKKNDFYQSLHKIKKQLQIESWVEPWQDKKIKIEEILLLLKSDKKKTSLNEVEFIIPQSVGDVTIEKISFSKIDRMMKGYIEVFS